MESKKNPKANLEKKRGTFLLGGLLIALLIMVVAFSWRTYEKEAGDLGTLDLVLDDEMIPVTERQQKPPPPPPPPPDIIEVVEDEVEIEEELEIEETETDEDEIVIIEEEEESDEIFNFAVVENKPIFPGCEDAGSKDEQYICFQQKIGQHIRNNFQYPAMAKELGIQGKVYVSFVIGKNGEIKDIQIARGRDKDLDAEAVRIIKKLPRMKPAEQRGKAVPVAYTVPINFKLATQ